MKKLLFVLSVVFVLLISTCVYGENNLEYYTKLLTDYSWSLDEYYYVYQQAIGSGNLPNFEYVKQIQLPDERVTLSGDDSGRLFLVVIPSNDYSNLKSIDDFIGGRPYLAEVSFNSTQDIMILSVNGYCFNSFYKYVRN